MNILIQIIVFIGVAIVVYAIYSIFSSGGSSQQAKPKRKVTLTSEEPESLLKEQKIQRLEAEIRNLVSEAEKIKADYANLQKELEIAQNSQAQLQEELTRRQDWVAKSEGALNKVKKENLNLQDKFIVKEKELQEEFTKNVDLNRELRELKQQLKALEEENKEKTEQIESLRHQIEGYAKEIKTHQETIAEFKKKEEISEWVPKQEFNKLNQEYIELEKELAEKEDKLKSLAHELMQLKSQQANPPQPKQ